MIEVCFCVYKRWQRVPDILQNLLNQTNQDFKVNIWNNSGQNLDVSKFPAGRIQVIDLGCNLGSAARFKIVPRTMGNPIIFFDDDEILDNDFVDYYWKQYQKFGPDYILGWFTRIFNQEHYWHSIPYSIYGTEVDYVGTGGMILDRKIFDQEQSLADIPEEFSRVEDLYLGYIARMKYGMKLSAIEKKCSIMVDVHDQFRSLTDYKQKTFLFMRQKGWKILKDKI